MPDFIPYLYAPESLLRGPESTFLRFFMGWIIALQNAENVEISIKKRPEKVSDFMAEDGRPIGCMFCPVFKACR